MTKIPKISRYLQRKHTGETAAVVDGKIVAFGKDSYKAQKNAEKKGYAEEGIMTAYIMGEKPYVPLFSILRR